jgi:hypothetical protein
MPYNAKAHLRANQAKCERSELQKIARLVQRTFGCCIEIPTEAPSAVCKR